MSTKAGKGGLVPRLRFPEFREAGEWVETTIGEIGSFYYGKSAPKWSLEENAQTKCVRYGELYTKFGAVITETYSRTNIDPSNLRFSKGGEILVPRVGEKPEDFGKCCCYLPLENIAIGEMISIFETAQNPLFYTYYFRNLYRQFAKVVEGQNVKNLYYVELEPLPICRPPLSEQQKIADCLSSLDELITLEAQKLDTLKTHKKGLMQQLFPAEGETLPRLRFPEFWDAGEWVREELSSCLEKVIDYRGKAPPKSESGVPLITAKNVRFGWLDMSCDEYIEADEYEDWMSKGIPKAGDILFTTEAPLGNVALFPSTGKFALGQRIITLRTRTKKCLPEFLFQSLLGPQMQKEVDFHSTGSTAKGIKSSVFVNINFYYPGIAEQQKIASCLTSLDDLITAQTQKLAALKTHKKGLMQQLFPHMPTESTP